MSTAQDNDQHQMKGVDADTKLNQAAANGSATLATDERDLGGDECQFLKLDGFFLPIHKIDRQKSSRCTPHYELNFANRKHQLDASQDIFGRSK